MILSYSEFVNKYRKDLPSLSENEMARLYVAGLKLEDPKYRNIFFNGGKVEIISTKVGRKSVRVVRITPEDSNKHVRLEYRTDLDKFETKDFDRV